MQVNNSAGVAGQAERATREGRTRHAPPTDNREEDSSPVVQPHITNQAVGQINDKMVDLEYVRNVMVWQMFQVHPSFVTGVSADWQTYEGPHSCSINPPNVSPSSLVLDQMTASHLTLISHGLQPHAT